MDAKGYMGETRVQALGCVGKLDLASSGPFSARPHPAASTIEQTSPASPSLPDEKTARSRADDGVFRQSLVLQLTDHSSRSPSGHEHCELITLIGDIMATRSIFCYRTKD